MNFVESMMITRRTFLKRLGQVTIIALANPMALAEMVKPNADPEDVLGVVVNQIRATQLPLKYIRLPAKEFDILLTEMPACSRFANQDLLKRGLNHILVKSVPIVRMDEAIRSR